VTDRILDDHFLQLLAVGELNGRCVGDRALLRIVVVLRELLVLDADDLVAQCVDARVGGDVAVHTDCVFIDGRIAAGPRPVDIEKIVRDVYRAAGYGGSWNPDPGKNLCDDRALRGGIASRRVGHPALLR
jgi:predicted Rdx family selenoprotein